MSHVTVCPCPQSLDTPTLHVVIKSELLACPDGSCGKESNAGQPLIKVVYEDVVHLEVGIALGEKQQQEGEEGPSLLLPTLAHLQGTHTVVDKVGDVAIIGGIHSVHILHVVQVEEVCSTLAVVDLAPPLRLLRSNDLRRGSWEKGLAKKAQESQHSAWPPPGREKQVSREAPHPCGWQAWTHGRQ